MKIVRTRDVLLVCQLAVILAAGQTLSTAFAGSPEGFESGVTYERLINAAKEPANWLTYSGQYNCQRYSTLTQINRETVKNLRVKWIRQFPTQILFETSPLVVDGTMYITLPNNQMMSLDAKTGATYWTYQHTFPTGFRFRVCCGRVNRGVALLGETVYMGTLDARLVALDAGSGRKRWEVEVANPDGGHSITAAPLIVKDMVVTGIAGGEFGVRGFLDAYDPLTGKRLWRTYTTPGPGEPGNKTWEGDSWKTGGAPTWMTGAFDPELDLIYWGTGNPSPDYNGEVRQGDNLYSDCVLAVKPDTGEIIWHFQFTPHDVHDWDAAQIPILVDADWKGKPRKLMLWANRNAFYYVLDRQTGEFLLAQPFAKQTWAEGIDEKGRPIRLPGTFPSTEGTLVFPDASGAANWHSPTYSPQTGLYYQMAFDGGAKYFTGEAEQEPGAWFLGSGVTMNELNPDPEYVSAVRALNALSGDLVWEYRVLPKSTSGLLSTAGGLVFGGSVDGSFFALDAETGEELWRLETGGRVHAAPVTYVVDGSQRVTIAAGNALFTFGL